jgi:5-methylcytosine-specific restriction protein A
MPIKPPRICGCGKVVASGIRCECQLTRDHARRAASDARRPTAAARGYDSKWAAARKGFLLKHPVCCRPSCGQPATIVHHSTPHRGDMKLFWDRSLWLPVCQPCHDGPLQSIERRAPKTEQRNGR